MLSRGWTETVFTALCWRKNSKTVLSFSLAGKTPLGGFLGSFLMMIPAWPFQDTPSHSESPGSGSPYPDPTALIYTPATIAAGLLLWSGCARHGFQRHLEPLGEHKAIHTPSLTQLTSCCHACFMLPHRCARSRPCPFHPLLLSAPLHQDLGF